MYYFFFIEYVSVCDKCMVVVTPGTIKFCQSGCRKRMKFSNLCQQHPEEFRVYGGVCKKCMPNAIVESISAKSLNESEEAQNRETILVINDSHLARILFSCPAKPISPSCSMSFHDFSHICGFS